MQRDTKHCVLLSSQPAVFFSHTKLALATNQPAVIFSHNKYHSTFACQITLRASSTWAVRLLLLPSRWPNNPPAQAASSLRPQETKLARWGCDAPTGNWFVCWCSPRPRRNVKRVTCTNACKIAVAGLRASAVPRIPNPKGYINGPDASERGTKRLPLPYRIRRDARIFIWLRSQSPPSDSKPHTFLPRKNPSSWICLNIKYPCIGNKDSEMKYICHQSFIF